MPSKYYRGGFLPKMTENEASQILGLGFTSTKSDIIQSHRRLIIINHPDRGGSPYVASKINEAKNMLLKDK